MKKPKISIIMAVYNTEKYVEKSIDSILNQTYHNYELIIIEDKSTDNSKKILSKYEKRTNIKIVYNEANKGLSYCRNLGVKLSKGEYVGFIDSDDYVEKKYFDNLVNSIIKEHSQIAICDIKIVYENNEIISKCYSNDKFSLMNVINNGLVASACNKLFLKKLLLEFSFPESKINEDIAVVIPALIKATKISYVNENYYYYFQRTTSIQNNRFSERRFDIFESVDLCLERIKGYNNYKAISEAIVYNQIIVLLMYVIPKEKDLRYRKKILKKFDILSKKYQIRKNRYFWLFLEENNSINKYYYKIMFKLNCSGLYEFTNILIFLRQKYNEYRKKNVIEENIDINDLIRLSKKQYNMKDVKYKVSVVIPNYNYAKFMYQRLFSVLNQNYKIHELIILDDNSKDNSVEIIDSIIKKMGNYINIKTLYNLKNSGSAFKQWKKGFEIASGDYVWIAEADDYCEPNFLETVIKPLYKDKDIMISYCDTAFIDVKGNIILRTIKSEIDILNLKHWDKDYINNGVEEVKNYTYNNCTIANVSSTIMKNGDYSDLLQESGNYKQAGDWLFYINLMSKGKIAYSKKVLNYYRMHGNNVSSTMNYKNHIEEIKKIHRYCVKKFSLSHKCQNNQKRRIAFLKKVWKVN